MSETKEREEKGGIHIDTGGGQAYVGDVTVKDGDFVGGDRISVGGVSGDNVAIAAGRGAQAEANTGVSGGELAELFAAVYRAIEDRPEDPDVDKEELVATAQHIEAEAAKDEEANPNKVERWLHNLAAMAPDIVEVVVGCLTHPAAGVGTVIRKIAEKARAEAQAAGG